MNNNIKKRGGRVIINISIILSSTLICLFFLEFMMRKLYPSFDPRGKIIFEEIEEDLILGKPYFSGKQWRTSNEFNVHVNINKYGFRDNKDLKTASSTDLFIVGDSFGFGHGVEENERYGNVIDSLFSNDKTVYNIAISESHFLNYKRRLGYAKEKGGEVKNIIVGVCMENDILDYNEVLKDRKFIYDHNSSTIKGWLNNHSCLYNYTAITLKSNRKWRLFLENIGFVKDEIYLLKPETNQELESSLEQLLNIIEGYNSLVILIPSRMIWEDEQKKIAEESHLKFKQLLDSHQILYLDLKSILELNEENPLLKLHFKYDGHWNKEGHKIVGQAIYEEWNKLESSEIFKTSENSN